MPDRALVELLDHAVESILEGRSPATAGDPELAPLVETARSLRDLPSEDFKTRLKTELQRRSSMTASATEEIRTGFRTVTPFIIHENAPELVDFLKSVFSAEELKRNTGEAAYGFYSEVRIGDTVVMVGGGEAASHGNLPSALHVYVEDCDAAYRRALDAGAVTLMGARGEPTDQPYGERSASVQDRFGNYWYIATRLASTAAAEGSGTVLPCLHPQGARNYIDFLKRAFGAEEIELHEESGRIIYAALRVGNAVLEVGEAYQSGIPSNGLFWFVEDVDAAFARAVEAGATAIRPPQDIPYQLRSAIVRDPAGYLWWPARRLT